MESRDIEVEPVDPPESFHWYVSSCSSPDSEVLTLERPFLVFLIGCIGLTILFVFYFNRIIALLLSHAVKQILWRRYRVSVKIQALQVSLIGGRIFFKGIQYHGHNETILIHSGHITWKYWLRKVRVAEVLHGKSTSAIKEDLRNDVGTKPDCERAVNEEIADSKRNEALPCRIQVKTSGVEVFFYNRSPAYDLILEGLLKPEQNTKTASIRSDSRQHSQTTVDKEAKVYPCANKNSSAEQSENRPHLPHWLAILPISLECKKGAIVIGNENTRGIVTAKFNFVEGSVDACPCGPLDVYKQLFSLAFTGVIISLNNNPDFKRLQLATAVSVKGDGEGKDHTYDKSTGDGRLTRKRRLKALWSALSPYNKSFRSATRTRSAAKQQISSSVNPEKTNQNRWQGLTRYQNAVDSEGQEAWDAVEYAKVPNVAEFPDLKASIFWDIPGIVPHVPENPTGKAEPGSSHGNNASSPEYGVELHLNGGTVNYGPWADRHRINLQQIFFPQTYKDVAPAATPMPGQERAYTLFKIYVEVHKVITIRVPTREASKDWKWNLNAGPATNKSKNDATKDQARLRNRKKSIWDRLRRKNTVSPEIRPMGWLDIKINADSTVVYDMAMVPGKYGFSNALDIDCCSIEISSSVNHGLLWRSGRFQLNSDLSNPCQWNMLRIWTFNISCDDLEFFVLRDHAFLLTDLVNDWATGPASDFYTFVPFQYILKVNLRTCKVYLNANDGNIINNPSDVDDNTFLLLQLPTLCADVEIPLMKLNAIKNKVVFGAISDDAELHLSAGARSTLRTYMKSTYLAKAGHFNLKGEYSFFAESSALLTDTLTLDIQGSDVALSLYGFLIHYFIQLKENYFGDYIHFKTMEEFQGLPSSMSASHTQMIEQEKLPSNDLDVILFVSVSDSSLLLPSNLYTASKCIQLLIPYLYLDLRVTNYYMDMTADLSPISIKIAENNDLGSIGATEGDSQLFLDYMMISGHRLFGLPPSEPTYVCIWDFKIGDVTGECSLAFGERLAKFMNTFPFALDNAENALSLEPLAIISDVTFLRLRTENINMLVHMENFATQFRSSPLSLDFNDHATGVVSQRLKLSVSEIIFALVEEDSSATSLTQMDATGKKRIVALLKTALFFNMLITKENAKIELDAQQHHLRKHDSRTCRCSFLLIDETNDNAVGSKVSAPIVRIPAMTFPQLPLPLRNSFNAMLRNSGDFIYSSNSSFSTSRPSMSSYVRNNAQPYLLRNSNIRQMGEKRTLISGSQSLAGESHVDSTTKRLNRPINLGFRAANHIAGDCQIDGEVPCKTGFLMLNLSDFSSPYFPLLAATIDLKDLPCAEMSTEDFSTTNGSDLLVNTSSYANIGNTFSRISLIVDMGAGIQAYCIQKAITMVPTILSVFDSVQPVDIIDDLQVKVMEIVTRMQSIRPIAGSSFNMGLNITSIDARFDLMPDPAIYGKPSAGSDRYEIHSHDIKFMFRSKSGGASTKPKAYSSHVTLRKLSASLLHRLNEGKRDDLVAAITTESLTTWLSDLRKNEVGVTLDGLKTKIHSNKISFLREAIERIEELKYYSVNLFSELRDSKQSHLRRLIYILSSVGDRIPDPPFISRPSYTSRAYAENFRNDNSWKILSRFRYILQSLPEDLEKQLNERNNNENENRLAEAKDYVLSKLCGWQICDPEDNLQDSCFIQLLFNQVPRLNDKESEESQFALSLRLLYAQVVIDPGPKQSILTIDSLIAYLEICTSQSHKHIVPSGSAYSHCNVTLELYLKNVLIGFDWSLLETLKKDSVLFEEHTTKVHPTREDQISKDASKSYSYQIVIITERGNIQIDSIHLAHVSESTGLSFSFTGNPKTNVNMLLHADSLSSSLYSTSRAVWVSSLTSSYLSISRRMPHDKEAELRWQIIGSADRAYIEVKEEIHSLIEIADKVVLDEIAYLKQWYDETTASKFDNANVGVKDRESKPRLSLALLLNSYLFQCMPIHTLLYEMKGRSLRIAASIVTQEQLSMIINYDLNRQVYSILNQKQEDMNLIARVNLPPIGGQLKMLDQQYRKKITTSTVLEEIRVDARSIYALLNLVNRPEIESAYGAIREDFDILKSNVRALSKDEDISEMRKRSQKNVIIYDVFCTSGGIKVDIDALARKGNTLNSSFAFYVQSIQLKAANVDATQDLMLKIPDIRAKVRNVGIEVGTLIERQLESCGSINFDILASCKTRNTSLDKNVQDFKIHCKSLRIDLYGETAMAIVSVADHLQQKFRDLDLSKERNYLRKLRRVQHSTNVLTGGSLVDDKENLGLPLSLLTGNFSFDVYSTRIKWIINDPVSTSAFSHLHDLILSIEKVALRANEDLKGKLSIEEVELQMMPPNMNKVGHTKNYARLPKVVFNVALLSSSEQWSLRFRATGQPLDVHLKSDFLRPANILKTSMEKAMNDLRSASLNRKQFSKPAHNVSLSKKKLGNCTIDADFAGAKVQMDMDKATDGTRSKPRSDFGSQIRYEKLSDDDTIPCAVLWTPGVALKLQYTNNISRPKLFADICIQASTNNLAPTFVPIVLDVLDSIKRNVREDEQRVARSKLAPQKNVASNSETTSSALTIEKTKLHLGIRVCRQEFSLTCRPIAKVAATASFDEVYLTLGDIYSADKDKYYSLTGTVKRFRAAIQHVYSQESTFNLNIHSILLSIMSTKALNQQGGISAVIEMSPVDTQLNAKKLQDFLLFRDIWVPDKMRGTEQQSLPSASSDPHEYFIQRYRQIAAATPFSWAITLTILDSRAEIDLGQAIGKLSIRLSETWISSRKPSSWEQTLCAAIGKMSAQSVGRMSGEVNIDDINLQTSITWPQSDAEHRQTPLVQGSLRFDKLLVKIAFDYQAFIVSDVRSFEFLMFNIRNNNDGDRLFAQLNGKRASAFITALSISQAVALIQAFERLNQDNKAAYQQALAEVDKVIHRKNSSASGLQILASTNEDEKSNKAPISLRTTIVVTLKAVSFGAFPSNFYDSQVLLMEHLNAEARFAVAFEEGKIHSGLGMTLGQLHISLSPVSFQKRPDSLDKLKISEIVDRATSSRSGTILRVPRVVAQMHSWQVPASYQIDYTFKSIFEGKVDVGWNYSRISFIRSMWNSHTKALSSRLGRPVRESAVQIRGLDPLVGQEEGDDLAEKQEAIKAVVNVPQSKYSYTAIGAPVIEAPQLRDMGEATPPLEWIGLQRERLPNVTHQIVIVALLEVAKEVEDAYIKILGSS